MRAPMAISWRPRSSTSGSRAAFSMTERPSARTQAIKRLSVAVWLGYSRVMWVARSRPALDALIDPRSLWKTAPISPSPSVWKLMGRCPKSSPPGRAIDTSPQRASSGPRITMEARMASKRCAGATVRRSPAAGTTISSSWGAGDDTLHPRATSNSPMVATSAMSGTLRSRWVPEASKHAAICFRTAFLAP